MLPLPVTRILGETFSITLTSPVPGIVLSSPCGEPREFKAEAVSNVLRRNSLGLWKRTEIHGHKTDRTSVRSFIDTPR